MHIDVDISRIAFLHNIFFSFSVCRSCSKAQTYRGVYPHTLNPPTFDENFGTRKMAGRDGEKGPRERESERASAQRSEDESAVTPTLIHFPPYLAANYEEEEEEEEGNKKRAIPPPPLFFVLSDLPRSTTSPKECMNGAEEEGCYVGWAAWGRLVALPAAISEGHIGRL